MNETHSNKLFRVAQILFALLAVFGPVSKIHAQREEQIAGDRWLFIFETSADMKPRVPALQAELNSLLAMSMGGQLRDGDSIGVWTFDQNVHTGQFPLSHWAPENAKAIASGLNKFVSSQRFTKGAGFDELTPLLNQVAHNSTRLTVLVFCDGVTKVSGTPYDNGINQIFQQRQAGQKATRQPFVLVLRTQLGQFIGCTLNFPPGMVGFPEFPPLPPPPAPPAPTNTPPPPPPPPPPRAPQPLIIIGTNVETSWPPAPKPAPAIAAPVAQTNPVPAPQTNTPPPLPPEVIARTNVETNLPPPKPQPGPAMNAAPVTPTNVSPVPPAVMVAQTNLVLPVSASAPTNPVTPATVAAPPENSGPGHKRAVELGAVLLIAASALIALAVFRARRSNRGSLISHSMKKR